MKNSVTDRALVRQYLLGKLDEQSKLEESLSERILFNDDMMEMAESIEEEILEEYLDGSLDSADKNAVDQYFLQPPQRRERLRFSKLLRRHCDTNPGHIFDKKRLDLVKPPATWFSHFRTHGQFAALLLITVSSLIYIIGVRKTQVRLEAELATERERSLTLGQQAELLQPAMVPLTLAADRSRDAGTKIPQVKIKTSTRRIIVDIVLQGGGSGPYDVGLETKRGKAPFWSARLLPLTSATGGARLLFDFPAPGIASGVYSFVVSSANPGVEGLKYYDFQVELSK